MIKKIFNLKFAINDYRAGMTAVELVVVLGIFAVLSAVVTFNYGNFQDKVDIKNLGSDIALKIVEAQKSSVNGMRNSSADADWTPSYGVYFDINNPKQFIYFADLNNDFLHDGGSENLDVIEITKNNYISRIDRCADTACSTSTPISNPLSVIFKRPDSSAIFVSPGLSPGFDHIQITIASLRGGAALIKLYPSGRIQVN